ncbi:MAG: hypothetical protein AAF928_07465 [Myxococcota bacterium]
MKSVVGRRSLFAIFVVVAGSACGGASTTTGRTEDGAYAARDDLLRHLFRRLPSAEPKTLTELTRHARQTPGIADAGRYADPDGMQLTFSPPLDAEALAFMADWEDVFVLPGPLDRDPYVLVLFRRLTDHSASFARMSFDVPEAGHWRVFAEVDVPPTGPFPTFGTGATGAYPLVDYPVNVDRLTVVDRRHPR